MEPYLIPIQPEVKLWKKPLDGLNKQVFRVVFKQQFINLWSMGLCCDYQFTWVVGKLHFLFLLNELFQGRKFVMSNLQEETQFEVKNLDHFIQWMQTDGKEYTTIS